MRVDKYWLALAVLIASAAFAQAQTWPDKPIRMIVPLAAASAVDNAARIVKIGRAHV